MQKSNDKSGGVELLHNLSESIFGAVAKDMVALGWSVFPQENNDKRRPGQVYGDIIKWSEDHDLANKLPDPKVLDLWISQCDGLNVACVMGPASGHAFAIDIDVTDLDMSMSIRDIAEDVLGPTPFVRVGRSPKVALIYRHDESDSGKIPSISRFFSQLDHDGNAVRSGYGLEIIGPKKALTFHGRHHSTGGYFRWVGDATPLLDGPERAPLLTADLVQSFFEAVDSRFPFHRGASFDPAAVTWQYDSNTNLSVPRLAWAAGGAPWQENSDGLVCDGRETYLLHLVYRSVTGNSESLLSAINGNKESLNQFKAAIASVVEDTFRRTAIIDGRWLGGRLVSETRNKVSRLVDKFSRGDMTIPTSHHIHSSRPPLSTDLSTPESTGDPDLSFLQPPSERKKNALKGALIPPEPDHPSLAIAKDRDSITSLVQSGLIAAFKSFFDDVYNQQRPSGDDDSRTPLHILRAPTGAGKTTFCLKSIAEDQRTYNDYAFLDRETGQHKLCRAPFVMLLPTYQNIDELRSRADILGLDGNTPDTELRQQAENLGLISNEDVSSRLSDLRKDALSLGLSTMVYSGKIRAGCLVPEKMRVVMESGFGTSTLCKTKILIKNTDRQQSSRRGYRDIFCEHYDVCPVIAQKSMINNVHLVFMPHSFLSLTIPDELKQIRGVIADEKIHHLFLHTRNFPANILTIARRPPKITKREKEEGVDARDFLADRSIVSDIALNALYNGQCPAAAIFSLPYEQDGLIGNHGLSLVKSALRVCGDTTRRDGNITPETSFEDILDICSQPTGQHVREEWRFWKIIEERISFLQKDAIRMEQISYIENDLRFFQGDHDFDRRLTLERNLERLRAMPCLANGDRDVRIQFLTDTSVRGGTHESVRISWRTKPNWIDIPTLLLDASAAPSIISKIWETKEDKIQIHDVGVDIGTALNLRIVAVANQTFSNSSIAGSSISEDGELILAARNLDKVRQAVSVISSLYGEGRVVAGTSILLREVINHNWACPDNIDWCHFGAMRGLDIFKHHSAAISVGRMEPPIRTIDGLAAALTYDDPDPEMPYDSRGDGRSLDKPSDPLMLPISEQRTKLRSGHIVLMDVPMFPGKWGRLVQKQYREEELLQFVGRLRPVYRDGRPPVWFSLSSIIPDSLVVDDVIHIDDLCGPHAALFDAVRQTGGILEPSIISKTCPSLFRDGAKSVKRSMVKAGFSLDGCIPSSRFSQGFNIWRWYGGDGGEGGVAFVRASLDNQHEKLISSLKSVLKTRVSHAELIFNALNKQNVAARQRSPDFVDARIGSVNSRIKSEQDCIDKVESLLKKTSVHVNRAFSLTPQVYAIKTSSGKKEAVTIKVAVAYFNLSDYWSSAIKRNSDKNISGAKNEAIFDSDVYDGKTSVPLLLSTNNDDFWSDFAN